MLHLIRDAQQKKAKIYCFDLLDDKNCFWLKDYSQKNLPVHFQEGQKDYFGKKGMSMHVDVFFSKENDAIGKQVYLSLIYRCQQGVASTLCISENVLREYQKNNPHIKQIFTKSDNAGAYHGNYVFEALYNMCKNQDLKLMRSDFNEPCRGRDQCDRESAAASSIINSFVDAGNDLVSAEDVYKALHYGNIMKDTSVCVLQIDEDNTQLSGEKIKNVSNYHSICYYKDYMELWRYFNIGVGVKEKYTGVKFVPKYNVVMPFSFTDKHASKELKKSKPQEDRMLCTLLFCSEDGCAASFKEKDELDAHVLNGKHIYPKEFIQKKYQQWIK